MQCHRDKNGVSGSFLTLLKDCRLFLRGICDVHWSCPLFKRPAGCVYLANSMLGARCFKESCRPASAQLAVSNLVELVSICAPLECQ